MALVNIAEYRRSGGTRRTDIRGYRGGPVIGYCMEICWTFEWETDADGYTGAPIDPDSLAASNFFCSSSETTPDGDAPAGTYRESWDYKPATVWL